MKGYHYDSKSNFLVMQRCFDSILLDEQDDLSHFWKYANEDLFKKKQRNFKIRVIESYDYNKLIEQARTMIEINTNSTYMSKIEIESNFKFAFKTFLKKLFEQLFEARPRRIESLNNDEHYQSNNHNLNANGRVPQDTGHLREQYLEEPIRTKEFLQSFLSLSENEVESLTNSHQNFIEHLNHYWPYDLINKLNKFNSFLKGNGYIFLGNKGDESQLMLNIKTLRTNGAKLPIEVIIPFEEDFDFEFCNVILPTLGGTCKVLTHYIHENDLEKIQENQLRSLALIISSFKNVLYMDVSNLAIKNPDILFVNKPFINNHLVVWPDLTRRSTSPYFYQISAIKVEDTMKVRNSYFSNDPRGNSPGKYSYHDTKGTIAESSSSGDVLLINKKVHFKTLILALYYNLFGPNFYYPLLNQGGAPENDKETFIAAAHQLGLPYYQVKEFPREFGPLNEARHHEIYAVGQYDPIVDYIQSHEESEGELETFKIGNEKSNSKRKTQTKKTHINMDDNNPLYGLTDFHNTDTPTYGSNAQDSAKNNYDYHLFKASNLFFIRAQKPKLDVMETFLRKEDDDFKKKIIKKRLFGKELIRELNGYDFELSIMKNLNWMYCEAVKLGFLEFQDWNSDSHRELCSEINSQVEFLSDSKKMIYN
ncbi:mannosyltransferase putative-domain-containing protein [Scheffersomyces coipomensis]|uniref:mannosyltransferase putative-domain-containing protein n=1 Tax=Scheffersomyces coipomensis TaxID=1788519 RepID=UPI00315CD0E8